MTNPETTPDLAKEARVEAIQGAEGISIYVNDIRIAGPKPWGGGSVIGSWKVPGGRITTALHVGDI